MSDMNLISNEIIRKLVDAYVWIPIKSRTPEPGRSYLIRADYNGMIAYDVAFYEGRRPNGDHWWVMGNVELDSKCIEHWREIIRLEEKEIIQLYTTGGKQC